MPRIVLYANEVSDAVIATIGEAEARLGDIAWLLVMPTRKRRLTVLVSDRAGRRRIVAQLSRQRNVRILQAEDPSGYAFVAYLDRFQPDLLLALDPARFGPEVVAIPRLGTLRLAIGAESHEDEVYPGFWELWEGKTEIHCGVSQIGRHGEELGLIADAPVKVGRYATLEGIRLLIEMTAATVAALALSRALLGTAPGPRREPPQPAYPAPSLAQIAVLRARLKMAAPPRNPLREAVKCARFLLLLGLGYAILWTRQRPHVTVLNYHRVNDDLRDRVTVGVEQFARHMAVLRRFCRVLSIEDLVAGRIPRTSLRPLVTVTFDDGYKDNAAIAFPILLRYSVPAAFFVATGFIGKRREFPHDAEKGIRDLPNMDWDDLRRMRHRGYIVGSHTVNHIDCGRTFGVALSNEIRLSFAELREKLGLEHVIFAYPFGREENMSASALACVKEAGYIGCLSAYGGVNSVPIDPFDVRRVGVNWGYTGVGFLCRALGLA